jgi:hypothetical protein
MGMLMQRTDTCILQIDSTVVFSCTFKLYWKYVGTYAIEWRE